MTTIVIDCENQSVHADRCRTMDRYHSVQKTVAGHIFDVDHQYCHTARRREVISKVVKRGDVAIVGTGDSDMIDTFATLWPDVSGISFADNGEFFKIFVVAKRNKGVVVDEYTSIRTKGSFFRKATLGFEIESYTQNRGYITSGSGGSYAMGALKAGKTPRQAIEIASLCDPGTSSECDSVKL